MKRRFGGKRWWGYLGVGVVIAACGSGLALRGGVGAGSTVSQAFMLLYSNIHHYVTDPPSRPMSLSQEISQLDLPNAMFQSYHEIPDIMSDDDGYFSSSNPSAGCSSGCSPVQYVTHSLLTKCGYTQTSLAARIADCQNVNHGNATWVGQSSGNAGQNTWYLVTKTDQNGFEVWQDAKTSLVWSDVWHDHSLAINSTNWCRAAGNAQAGDPQNYCNNLQPSTPFCYVNYPSNSTTSIQCQTAAHFESDCAEGSTVWLPAPSMQTSFHASQLTADYGTPNAPNQTYAFYEEKGYMLHDASSNSPSIFWRLPTKYDYQQADNDGMRFVLPNMSAAGYVWSASVVSVNRFFAWVFNGSNGNVSYNGRFNSYPVLCVGRE